MLAIGFCRATCRQLQFLRCVKQPCSKVGCFTATKRMQSCNTTRFADMTDNVAFARTDARHVNLIHALTIWSAVLQRPAEKESKSGLKRQRKHIERTSRSDLVNRSCRLVATPGPGFWSSKPCKLIYQKLSLELVTWHQGCIPIWSMHAITPADADQRPMREAFPCSCRPGGFKLHRCVNPTGKGRSNWPTDMKVLANTRSKNLSAAAR